MYFFVCHSLLHAEVNLEQNETCGRAGVDVGNVTKWHDPTFSKSIASESGCRLRRYWLEPEVLHDDTNVFALGDHPRNQW